MGKDLWDTDIPGQVTLDELFTGTNQMIAVSKILARAREEMSLYELKAFIYALTQIRWQDKMPNYVYMDKKTLADFCGVHSDPDHLSVHLHEKIKDLPEHSGVHFAIEDQGLYEDGVLISRVTMLKNQVRLKFDSDYVKLFSELQNGDYITMWADDLLSMENERSIQFYEDLRLNSDTRVTNHRGYGVRALKELFGIPETGPGSYMRDEKNGGFNRAAFEKRVIEPIVEDLSHCKMVQLLPYPDGKLYKKVKKGNRIAGYEFTWVVSNHPAVATAKEKKDLKEDIDKNPQVLKIAKDIADGAEKPKKLKGKSTNIENHEYDWNKMEKKLLDKS